MNPEVTLVSIATTIIGVLYILETRRENSFIVQRMEKRLLGAFFKKPTLRKISLAVGIIIVAISLVVLVLSIVEAL